MSTNLKRSEGALMRNPGIPPGVRQDDLDDPRLDNVEEELKRAKWDEENDGDRFE